MTERICQGCGAPFSRDLSVCPHCERPSLYPNVEDVDTAARHAALEVRYAAAKARAMRCGHTVEAEALEALGRASEACKALPAEDLARMALDDSRMGATYYGLVAGGCRIPGDDDFEVLRRIADAALHRSYGARITFAALSVGGRAPSNYGDGVIYFRESMIAHRATVFEENSALWVQRRTGELEKAPDDSLACWGERHKLVVAKLVDEACGTACSLEDLVLSCGATTATDQLLEVHIFGAYTVRSASRIAFREGALSDMKRKSIEERAALRGVSVGAVA